MAFLLSLALLAFALFYFYRRRRQSVFFKDGIKGPPPNFLFGNLTACIKTPFNELFTKWNEEYGKIFCYYEGPKPNLVIGDPDLLQEVLVKQFSNFHGRKLFPMQSNPDKDEKVSMFIARGKRWKRLRTTINPAFTDNKMRRMFPMVDESIKSLVSKISELTSKGSEEIEIQEFLQRLTMDIICKCAFGIDTNCQTNVTHPFVVSLKSFHSRFSLSNLKAALFMALPELKRPLIFIFELMSKRDNQNNDLLIIRNKMIEVIETRKKSPEKRFDLLQLLLEAEVPGTKILDEDNLCPFNDASLAAKSEHEVDHPEENKSSTSKPNPKPLTTAEIIAQANLFLFAGYETSSTALSYIMYVLSTHPDIQKRMHAEIDELFENLGSESFEPSELYDAIGKLPYLNAVIYEVLRFYPFTAMVFNRLSMKSDGTYLSNGLYIPPGVNVIPNLFAIHFDKDIWTTFDPQIFEPERFLQRTDNKVEFIGPPHPFAWLPFGGGPRNCVGQRFAMMVVRATLVRFFREFQVNICSKTEIPLKLKIAAVMTPRNGVFVEVIKRKNELP